MVEIALRLSGIALIVGDFKGPWRIIVLLYNPAVALSPTFQPITSAAALYAAEASGALLPISRGVNPYKVETGIVLICPLVSSHA